MMYVQSTLRRIRCMNWPRPIDAVSPSPDTPSMISWRFARWPPVVSAGMRAFMALHERGHIIRQRQGSHAQVVDRLTGGKQRLTGFDHGRVGRPERDQAYG